MRRVSTKQCSTAHKNEESIVSSRILNGTVFHGTDVGLLTKARKVLHARKVLQHNQCHQRWHAVASTFLPCHRGCLCGGKWMVRNKDTFGIVFSTTTIYTVKNNREKKLFFRKLVLLMTKK